MKYIVPSIVGAALYINSLLNVTIQDSEFYVNFILIL